MEPMTLDLAPQAAEVARVVAGVGDDQLGDPTPCAGTPVAGLLDHLVGLTYAFRLAAEKQPLGGAPRASAEGLPDGWRRGRPNRPGRGGGPAGRGAAAPAEPAGLARGGLAAPDGVGGAGRGGWRDHAGPGDRAGGAQRDPRARLGPRRRHGAGVPGRPGERAGLPGLRRRVRGRCAGGAQRDLRTGGGGARRRPGARPSARADREGSGVAAPRVSRCTSTAGCRAAGQTMSGTASWLRTTSKTAISVVSMLICPANSPRVATARSPARPISARLS